MTACALAIAALLGTSAGAPTSTPMVLTFSIVTDSRQDPVTVDKASVGNTQSGQDSTWLQNNEALARILRTVQPQSSSVLFFARPVARSPR